MLVGVDCSQLRKHAIRSSSRADQLALGPPNIWPSLMLVGPNQTRKSSRQHRLCEKRNFHVVSTRQRRNASGIDRHFMTHVCRSTNRLMDFMSLVKKAAKY